MNSLTTAVKIFLPIILPVVLLWIALWLMRREEARRVTHLQELDRLSRMAGLSVTVEFPGLSATEARRAFDLVAQSWAAVRVPLDPNCICCKHFHGQVYSGVPLICAIHPAGKLSCPDYDPKAQAE